MTSHHPSGEGHIFSGRDAGTTDLVVTGIALTHASQLLLTSPPQLLQPFRVLILILRGGKGGQEGADPRLTPISVLTRLLCFSLGTEIKLFQTPFFSPSTSEGAGKSPWRRRAVLQSIVHPVGAPAL